MNKGKQFGFFLGPLLFILLEFTLSNNILSENAIHVLAIGAWLVTWWITEAAPIPVTALLPLVLFPALGVMKMTDAAIPYANPVIFLFMGGFMIALALEKHKLHERIALNLIRITGTSGNGIILGFTLATGILSMWISNTATALMMLPIALSVVDLLKQPQSEEGEALSRNEKYFALGLLLTIGYSASIGGMATIIGTPPNVVFAGFMKEFYGKDLEFAKWMLVGLPVATITLFSCYFIITRILFPNKMSKVEGSELLIKRKLDALGTMKKEEKRVLAVFGLTSFCWIFQNPLNSFIGSEVFNDTNIAMTGGILMFLVPVNFSKSEFLLDWDYTKRLPFGILILFGGGICLAKGMETSGIVDLIGNAIAERNTMSLFMLIAILTSISLFLTEIMSNVALVTIFIPVVFGIANGLGINPIILGMPVTFAASCAFMFPISTPPNAIVFSSGYISMKDMVRAGILLDIASIIIILISTTLLVTWVYT
ncbi:MAG: DASS family sodium-coupled anion symporter [Flammeovirgaceae bacterium]|nr:DASS family sodium-coupled anion symporter [Flammeovirgaceae bacterium]